MSTQQYRFPLRREEREQLIAFLAPMLVETLFTPELEKDYIINGFNWRGLHGLSDQQLIELAETYTADQHGASP